jgi:hypothetical protein
MNKLRPYLGMIATMLGMDEAPQRPLPFHRPYVAFEERTGKRRIQKSRVNRAHWKCNEINPKTDEKRGHLDDIIQTYLNGTANVKCRRCGRWSIIKVKTKPYTSNKKVLAARAKTEAAAA